MVMLSKDAVLAAHEAGVQAAIAAGADRAEALKTADIIMEPVAVQSGFRLFLLTARARIFGGR